MVQHGWDERGCPLFILPEAERQRIQNLADAKFEEEAAAAEAEYLRRVAADQARRSGQVVDIPWGGLGPVGGVDMASGRGAREKKSIGHYSPEKLPLSRCLDKPKKKKQKKLYGGEGVTN